MATIPIRQLHSGLGYGTEIRCVEIVFSSNPDEREQRIALGIGERPPFAALKQYR